MSLEPRRLVRATLGHLVGRPWMVLKIFRWMHSSISDSVLDIVWGPGNEYCNVRILL